MNGQSAHNRAGSLNQFSGQPVELSNEFAAVTLSLDYSGRGPRLHVTDTESGEGVYLDPLLLSALCRSTPADRQAWLRTGDYGDNPSSNNGAQHGSEHGDHA
jgi:hypothetical protein